LVNAATAPLESTAKLDPPSLLDTVPRATFALEANQQRHQVEYLPLAPTPTVCQVNVLLDTTALWELCTRFLAHQAFTKMILVATIANSVMKACTVLFLACLLLQEHALQASCVSQLPSTINLMTIRLVESAHSVTSVLEVSSSSALEEPTLPLKVFQSATHVHQVSTVTIVMVLSLLFHVIPVITA